jgi:YD repeat-containing protein
MKNGFYLLTFMVCLTTVNTYGQIPLAAEIKLPQVAPPSPDAAMIEKFGNFPVTYSTGVPDISIPLWTIHCGSLNWPITLSYHASGFKVDESASIAGLGWAVLGQGAITRSVNGRPDEEASIGEPADYTTVDNTDYPYLYNVESGSMDAELDLFNFSFNGKSGQFVLSHDGNGTVFQIPSSNLKITHDANLTKFTIKDEIGAVYTFDKQEQTTTNSGSGTLISYTTTWYLSKVELPDQNNKIELSYDTAGQTADLYSTYTQIIGEKNEFASGSIGLQPVSVPISGSTSSVAIYLFKLSKITFPNGSVSFNYDPVARKDIGGGNNVYNKLTSVVINEVVNGVSTPAKTFMFNQSYFHYTPAGWSDAVANYRLRLDNLVEKGTLTGPNLKQYTFQYNLTENLSPRGSLGQDIWGFNNGKTTNQSLLETETVSYNDGASTVSATIGNADRSVNATKMKAWMLTEIDYPTGGKTVFEYEPHVYSSEFSLSVPKEFVANVIGNQTPPLENTSPTFTYPTTGVVPGTTRLLVDMSRVDFSNVTQPSVVVLRDVTDAQDIYVLSQPRQYERYTYDQPIALHVGHQYQLKATLYASGSESQLDASIRIRWSESGTVPDIRTGGGLRIKSMTHYADASAAATKEAFVYDTAVTLTPFHLINKRYKEIHYRLGVPVGTSCWTYDGPTCRVYHSQSVYALCSAMGSPMLYRRVEKIDVDPATSTPNGKTEYRYDVFQDPSVNFGGALALGAAWSNGFPISQTEYKYNAGTYSMIRKTESEYHTYHAGSTPTFRVDTKLIREGDCQVAHSATTAMAELNYYTYSVQTGSKRLAKQTVTEVDEFQHNLVTTTTNYYGSTDYDYPTAVVVVDSKNKRDSITYKRSPEFVSSGNVYDKMKQKNMLQPVIEQVAYSNATKLSTLKNNYRDWFSNQKVIALDTVQASIFSNALETRLRYYGYDAYNNPLSMGKDKDQPASYLWGYNNARPIAQVTNASSSSIAYTSFETSETGGWSGISAAGDYFNGSLTGRLAYTKNNFNFSKSGLSTSTAYIISYWSKNGSYTVNTTSGTAGRTVNGWTFYSHKVTPGSGSVSVTGSGSIDELRLYPAAFSQMTTYTYNPIGGVTTICDPNNRCLYYEYDELQRLVLIRDQDRNIVKKFSYNYNDVTEYPNIYYNTAQTVYRYKQGCTGCQIGSQVGYTVPAGVFLSTESQVQANILASAEASARAQDYANANGTCAAPTSATVTGTNQITNNGFSVKFHNNCTGTNYTYSLGPNANTTLSPAPPVGNYDVTITKMNGPGTYTYIVNSKSATTSSDPTLSNIDVASTGNLVKIQL